MFGIFLDTEANGLNSQIHKLLEVGLKIVDLNTGKIECSYQSVIAQPLEAWRKSDPNSLKVNGFTWDEIEKGLPAAKVAQQIMDLFGKWKIRRKEAVFICQNPSFDRVFFSQLIDVTTQELFQWPYHWLDLASMFWALQMDEAKKNKGPPPWQIGLSKDFIAAHYKLAKEEKPHRAMNGVDHLLLCYEAIVGFPSVT